jgi:hypothetical protein
MKSELSYYAGIGSRETPKEVCEIFETLAEWLSKHGYILRSGHAAGADQAFERGCDRAGGQKEIYLPWKGFEGSNSTHILTNQEAYTIAEQFHPYWSNLSEGAKKLQARNSHQVLGENLNTPSAFIVCWTKNGSGKGGTGQALRIAKHYGIPILDAGRFNSIEETKSYMNEFLKLIKEKA